MATIIFHAPFIASKQGVNGLTVTVDIDRITRSDGTRSALVTGGSATAVTRRGLYYYRLTNADIVTYDYVATFITADSSVDQQEVHALWTLWSLSWHDIATSLMTLAGSIGKLLIDTLDAAISTRLADADYTTPPTAADIDTELSGTHGAGSWVDAGGGGATAEEVWEYGTRTLTQTAAEVAAVLSGSNITIKRGDTFTLTLTGLGSIADRSKLWFTIKRRKSDLDSNSLVQIELADGLLYLNGAAAAAGNGSIAIDDEDAGDITVTLKAAATKELPEMSGLSYDVQVLRSDAATVDTLTEAAATVSGDVTRAVS